MRFNPFSFLFESKAHPHARTLRSGFSEKWQDSFSVFYGDIHTDKREARMGLFDWATLGIFALMARYEVSLKTEYTLLSLFLGLFMHALNKILIIPRFLVSAIAAVVATPFTLLVAGIVRVIDQIQSPDGPDEVEMIEGIVEQWFSFRDSVDKENKSLGRLFRELKSNFNKMHCIDVTSDHIKMRVDGNPVIATRTFTCDRNAAHAHQFFRYNIGGINNVLEKSPPAPVVGLNP